MPRTLTIDDLMDKCREQQDTIARLQEKIDGYRAIIDNYKEMVARLMADNGGEIMPILVPLGAGQVHVRRLELLEKVPDEEWALASELKASTDEMAVNDLRYLVMHGLVDRVKPPTKNGWGQAQYLYRRSESGQDYVRRAGR